MSVKSKVSLAISMIVFVLLTLNVILNDYTTRVNLKEDAKADIVRLSRQFAAAVDQYSLGTKIYEVSLSDKLKLASMAVAEHLPGDYQDVTDGQLAQLVDRFELNQLSVLRESGNSLVVMRSTDPLAVGQHLTIPVIIKQPATSDASSGVKGGAHFYAAPGPATAAANHPQSSNIWGYYSDAAHNYLLSVEASNKGLLESLNNSGPSNMLEKLIKIHPELLEVTVFNSRTFVPGASITGRAMGTDLVFNASPVMLGDYTFRDESDYTGVSKAAKGKVVVEEKKINGRTVLKSFSSYNQNSQFVIGAVVDESVLTTLLNKQRLSQIIIFGILLLTVIVCSYWLAGLLIRPVKSILWKVNEVSNGRFDSPIEVGSKDEFGQLAERINAMSKNLDIYTAKLKIAFEENRSMKEYLESFINHTTDAIHVVDLEGRIMQVNRAFEELFGWNSDEAIGRRLPIAPDSYLNEEKQTRETLESGKPLSALETIRMTKKGEWIHVSITTSPIREKNGEIRAIASITRDMTSRNKMDELLRRSEKLTTVGQLAAGVAHEIRNPLTTLRGFLQLQQETNKLNLSHTDLMLSELDRINLIVGEFLILAKPQASRYEIKDLRFVLGDVQSLLDSEAHLYNIVFETRFTSETCEISCEENQLKQVFINVLKNAMEAMPSGGRIRMDIDKSEAGSIIVSIKDEGVGIPEEMVPKLGDPFFTGKETGTGLGIMVSQRIIQSHQGSMEISSKLGEGTTVMITLPLIIELSRHDSTAQKE